MPPKKKISDTRAQARAAAKRVAVISEQVKEFNERVEKMAKEEGIDLLKAEIPVLNQRVLNFMQKEGMTRLDLDEDGYVNFIQATGEHVWILTNADIEKMDAPNGARSLRSILGKELFLRATRRVANPSAIEKLIEEGEITEKEVAPAHFTRMRAPYIRYVSRKG